MKIKNKLFFMFSRYLLMIILGLGNLFLFYLILTPLTINVFYYIVSVFTNARMIEDGILIGNNVVEIIPACVAAAGYYLLFVLCMTTKMKPIARLKATITAIGIFFGLNILRLLILTLFIGSQSFEALHWIFWHFVSTIFVVGTWFIVTKIYKIKEIPFYSDLKYINGLKRKNSKRKK